MEYFDVKKWMQEHFKLSKKVLLENKTNNSLEFVLVWALFENKYLKDSGYSSYNNQLVELSKIIKVGNTELNEIYGFLYNRYFNNGKTTKYYENLKFKKEWKKTTKEILEKTKPTDEKKLIFILLVIYKFRCNLFHGKKDPLLLKNFEKVFFHINKFLAYLLDIEKNVVLLKSK